MKKYLRVLRECPLFHGIGDENILKMLGCLGARVLSYKKKDTVFAEGSVAGLIGIVLSGAVQMIELDYNGNRSILSTFGAGELFAEEFACADVGQLPVSAVADAPSEIMLIESSHIMHTCSSACSFHGDMIYNLVKAVANKCVGFHRRIEATSKRTTRDKLLTYLMLEARRCGSQSFTIPYDRQELADYLEVDRSGLSSEISKLRREGIIECEKSRFKIKRSLY